VYKVILCALQEQRFLGDKQSPKSKYILNPLIIGTTFVKDFSFISFKRGEIVVVTFVWVALAGHYPALKSLKVRLLRLCFSLPMLFQFDLANIA